MDSSYITCLDTVARTRKIICDCTALNTRIFKLTFENFFAWKRRALSFIHVVKLTWNGMILVLYFGSIDVERGGTNTKERESWCNWRPHGVNRNETRASKLCVRVSAKTRGWKKQQTSPAHWSSNNGSFMCNHRRNGGCRRNALFDPKKWGLTRAKRISYSSRPTRIPRFLWTVFTRIRNGSNQKELNLFRPFLSSDGDREEIIYLFASLHLFFFFFSKDFYWLENWSLNKILIFDIGTSLSLVIM